MVVYIFLDIDECVDSESNDFIVKTELGLIDYPLRLKLGHIVDLTTICDSVR